ncbi:MAG: HAD-IA family hydrolase [Vicinamibacterales bacterium]
MTIRAVLFDLDDTLFDHQYCSRTALTVVRSMHSAFDSIDIPILEAAHSRILEALHADVMVGRIPLDSARVERFRQLYETAGVEADPTLASRTAVAYRDAYLDARQAVAGAASVLAAVHRRAKVGIVSNNLLLEQREKLRHCGLETCYDVLVVSEEFGVSKPDPRLFEIALTRLECAAHETVMVGDSWAADVMGALAAGIHPIWFNRNATERPAGACPVPVIASFEEVADVLQTIFKRACGPANTRR